MLHELDVGYQLPDLPMFHWPSVAAVPIVFAILLQILQPQIDFETASVVVVD